MISFIASSVTFLAALAAVGGSVFAVWQDYENRVVEPRWYFLGLKDAALKAGLFVTGICVFHVWLRAVF